MSVYSPSNPRTVYRFPMLIISTPYSLSPPVVHVYGKGAVSRIDAGLFDYAYVVAFYLPLADSDRNLHVSFFNFIKVDTYIKLLPVALF